MLAFLRWGRGSLPAALITVITLGVMMRAAAHVGATYVYWILGQQPRAAEGREEDP